MINYNKIKYLHVIKKINPASGKYFLEIFDTSAQGVRFKIMYLSTNGHRENLEITKILTNKTVNIYFVIFKQMS